VNNALLATLKLLNDVSVANPEDFINETHSHPQNPINTLDELVTARNRDESCIYASPQAFIATQQNISRWVSCLVCYYIARCCRNQCCRRWTRRAVLIGSDIRSKPHRSGSTIKVIVNCHASTSVNSARPGKACAKPRSCSVCLLSYRFLGQKL
jgi:hypothetical protein